MMIFESSGEKKDYLGHSVLFAKWRLEANSALEETPDTVV